MNKKLLKTWAEVSQGCGRNNLPWCLSENLDKLSQREIAKGLADAWTMCEFPNMRGTNSAWEIMFLLGLPNKEGFIDDNGKVHKTEELPEVLTLYRGAHIDHKEGMSWTTNLKTAQWFATRLGMEDTKVYTITIPREHILAKFDGRNEEEYVVNMNELFEDDVQELELADADN